MNALTGTFVVIALMTFEKYIYLQDKSKIDAEHIEHLLLPTLNYVVWLGLLPFLFQMILKVFASSKNANSVKKRNILLLGLSVGFTFLHELIGIIIYKGIYMVLQPQVTGTIKMDALGFTKTNFEFWILLFILMGFYSRRKVRLIKLKNAELEADLLKARMSALRNQLHPHFLFNTFNTISSLMEENVALAQRMIAKLGTLLRKMLKEGDSQFITVNEEVEFAKLYLEVEQIRFDGRLVAKFSINPSLANTMVPTLILQPLVENAIKHGFYNKTDECEICIRIDRSGETLILEVKDNGGGVKNEEAFSFGIGLENVRERLMRCFDDNYDLSIDSTPQGGGFCVTIQLHKIL
ncbi:MAG: histidine kinase [Cyclobacteriaceae bacterium]